MRGGTSLDLLVLGGAWRGFVLISGRGVVGGLVVLAEEGEELGGDGGFGGLRLAVLVLL